MYIYIVYSRRLVSTCNGRQWVRCVRFSVEVNSTA